MIVSRNYSVNEDGHLMIEACDAVHLAKTYSTPLYVMSENELLDNIKAFKDCVDKAFGGNASVAYASKALACKEVYRIIKREGLRLDVASAGELSTALAVGFPTERIYFHGNNKTLTELELAVEHNVGRIVVDNLYELSLLNDIAAGKGRVQKVLLRVKPGVDAHTHDYVKTGGHDSKFGLALDSNEVYKAVEQIKTCAGVELVGLHSHIGSQILDTEPFSDAASIMMVLLKEITDKYGAKLAELNLGGGFGIPYSADDKVPHISEYIARIADTIKKSSAANKTPIPHVTFEPGRFIVGTAGVTLYTVGSIKHVEGVKTYLAVDGGMADNPRYALYQSSYMALIANRARDAREFCVTIAGKCCESGDILQENIAIQQAAEGDILAVMPTGAYNYSMASNYNKIPRPAMVMVNGSEARVIVNRESVEDLMRNEI